MNEWKGKRERTGEYPHDLPYLQYLALDKWVLNDPSTEDAANTINKVIGYDLKR